MRKLRQFTDRNLVIVCEGTTTEYNYITEACDYAKRQGVFPFTGCTVLPAVAEVVVRNPNRKAKARVMGSRKEYRYYSKTEATEEDYKRYCGQPTRYLREAQLFIEEDGYVEGWAVYDKDRHSDHAGAKELLDSDSRLHVAFSAYSFEEWLLCHFEANPKGFGKSECADKEKKSYECGTSRHPADDCHGRDCIAGRLRETGYIPDFDKTMRGLFERVTLGPDGVVREKPLVNAAYLRHIAGDGNRFGCNPYTDVDRLVLRIMDDGREYTWHLFGEEITDGGRRFRVEADDGEIVIVNSGGAALLLPAGCASMREEGKGPKGYPAGKMILNRGEELRIPHASGGVLHITLGSRHLLWRVD